jgi:transcriptional regulator with XRE-family HTH domain
MIVGERLRVFREEKNLSQGDIEERTGLLRCYISRVENGHTIPAVETLEKLARALDMQLYQFLYDGPEAPRAMAPVSNHLGNNEWGSKRKDERLLNKLRRHLSRMSHRDRNVLMSVVSQMAGRSK